MSENSSNKEDSAVLVNEKGRNKRKYLSDQLTLDLSTEVSKLSLTEFPRYENLVERFKNAVDEWKAIMQRTEDATDEEGSEDDKDPEWDDPVAAELEDLLSHNLFTTFCSAVKKIVECGYTEQVAEWAILNSSFLHGSKDAVSNVIDPALAFLKKQKEFNTPKHSVFDGLQSLVDYTLLEMIFVLREVRPELTISEAMWALLISDLNLLNACSMERGPTVGSSTPGPNVGSSTVGPTVGSSTPGSTVGSATPGPTVGSSTPEASGETPKLPQSISETPIVSQTESAAPKAPVTIMGNQQSTCRKEPDEKSGGNKKGSASNSKRDMLRQKTFQFDKSYRGRLSKGAFKAKVAAWGSMVLDKSLKSQPGSSTASIKGTSSKITPPPVEGNAAAPAPSPAAAPSPAPAKIGTESCSKNEISVSDTPKAIDYCASIPFDETLQKHIPQDARDQAILMLLPRKAELEKELQSWVEWGNGKVMEAARRLGKDQPELKMLKQEREEMERYKKEKQTLEENTMKRLSEMEYALSNATGQIEIAKCSIHRLEEENDALKDDMEAAKMKAVRSAAKLEEAVAREHGYNKKLQSWEAEKGLALEQLTNLKRQTAALSNRVEKAKARREQFKTLFKQEEKEKLKSMKEQEAIRKKMEEEDALMRREEENIKQMAESDLKKYEENIKNLQSMISKLRLEADKSRIAALNVGYGNFPGAQLPKPTKRMAGGGGVNPERECVMCMTDEIAVVFLPCAHQVLCVKCSDLHEKQGMDDCPSCRTPIQKRITVSYQDN